MGVGSAWIKAAGLVHGLHPVDRLYHHVDPTGPHGLYAQYGLQTALIVLGGYILINGGVQNFIQPRMMGQA